MAWNASTDFKFDPSQFNRSSIDPGFDGGPTKYSPWGGSFDDAYKTDWNKDFTKNTGSGKNFGKEFLDQFRQNLFGGQGDSSSSFKGGGAYGANFNPFTADLGIITQGGGPTQYIAGQPGWGEKIANAALGAGMSAGMGALFG
jgi:hypothetical protein